MKRSIVMLSFSVLIILGSILLMANLINDNRYKNLTQYGRTTEATIASKYTRRERVSYNANRRRSNYYLGVTFFDKEEIERKPINFLDYQPRDFSLNIGEYYSANIALWLTKEEWSGVDQGERALIRYLDYAPDEFVVLEVSYNRMGRTIPIVYNVSWGMIAFGIISLITANYLIGRNPSSLYCPYCISKIRSKAKVCPTCEQALGNDAIIEMNKKEYNQEKRKDCIFCDAKILDIATKCAKCKRDLQHLN